MMNVPPTRPAWLLALLAIWLGFGDRPLHADDPPPTGRSIFQRSHVAAWFDGPEDHRKYNVDVMVQDMDLVEESEVPKWRAFVAARHAEGKLVCGELRPLTHMGRTMEYVMNDPGLQQAVCLNIEQQPIPIGWITGDHTYQGKQPNFYCSNHPAYRAYLRQQVFFLTETGVDAIMVDDGGGTFFVYGHGGCFCDYCMKAFRVYLQERLTPQQLEGGGIDDLEAFDYRKVVVRHANDNASYKKVRGGIPWDKEFRDFLVDSDVALFDSLQRMASRLSGRHIPFGWDNVDFGGSRAPYYPIWDVFYSEITYQHFAVNGRGPDEQFPPSIVMLDKLADALGKWYIPTPAPRSWATIRDKNLTGLLRQWIAFSYANGSAVRYPRKGWCFTGEPWYFPPQDEFEPIYDFVRRRRELFDDYEAVEQVGVLFTQTRGAGGVAYYSPLKYVCASLVEQNVPFGFAVAGDELLADRLRGDEADPFELMLIPEPIRLISGQQEIVDRWKAEKKALAVTRGDDVAALLGGRVEPLVAVEDTSRVWLFPRTKQIDVSAPVICHLVNASYDPQENRPTLQKDVKVRLHSRLVGGAGTRHAVYHTLGKEPQWLDFTVGKDGLQVTVPEIELWGILQVERRKAP